MPAPPPESEPAMVTAIGVMSASRAALADGTVADRPQLARGDLRITFERERGDHRHAVGTGVDHRRGVAGVDAGDAADRKTGPALPQHFGDAREPGRAD